MTVERNDVDITKLFNWGREFSIVDSSGNEVMKVYLRIIGDADLNRARVFALRKSTELRRLLKTEDSDERLAFIPDAYSMEREKVIELIIAYNLRRLNREAIDSIPVVYPKEIKSTATLEEQEKHQNEIDEWESTRAKKITEKLTKLIEEYRNILNSREDSSLYKEFEISLINELCESTMMKKFNEYCAFCSAYSDSEFKNKMFESFEKFSDLPEDIKEQFMDYYSVLDINSDFLKK